MAKQTKNNAGNARRAERANATTQARRAQPAASSNASSDASSGAKASQKVAAPKVATATTTYSTRREQRAQRHTTRAAALARQEQVARMRRYGLIGGGIVVVLLIALLIANSIRANASGSTTIITGTGTYTSPANGFTRDGMNCLGMEGTVEHIHMYLAIYVNGQQVQVPPNTGIVESGQCYYPLHVHSDPGDENIIHEESPNNDTYTLGAFFDVWGQPLSANQVMSYHTDASHKLTFVTFDGAGHKTVYTGNPLNIKFSEHETIYILYNSPNVNMQPFTKWIAGE